MSEIVIFPRESHAYRMSKDILQKICCNSIIFSCPRLCDDFDGIQRAYYFIITYSNMKYE